MESNVGRGAQILATAGHGDRLVAEGGEGSEAPEKTDEREGAQLGPEQLTRVREPCKSSDEDATQKIHRQGSIGERRQRKVPVDDAAQRVAKDGTGESSGAHQKRVQKNRLQSHPQRFWSPNPRMLSDAFESS